jgi:hypothetical protein
MMMNRQQQKKSCPYLLLVLSNVANDAMLIKVSGLIYLVNVVYRNTVLGLGIIGPEARNRISQSKKTKIS